MKKTVYGAILAAAFAVFAGLAGFASAEPVKKPFNYFAEQARNGS